MMPNEVDMKLCGALKLLGAIFGENEDRLMLKYGIIPPHFIRCTVCQKLIGPDEVYYSARSHHFCSKDCKDYHLVTMVECTNCGILIPLKTSSLIWRYSKNKQKSFFCSRKCQGRWASEHYLRIHGTHRKYNWDIVWQTHLMTGYGVRKLSRILDIPIPAISKILHKKRTEIIVRADNLDSITK